MIVAVYIWLGACVLFVAFLWWRYRREQAKAAQVAELERIPTMSWCEFHTGDWR